MASRQGMWSALALLGVAGCFDEPGPADWAGVYFDDFAACHYEAFLGSKVDALSRDTVVKHAGSAAIKITVPAPGGSYAGGAIVSEAARDLSSFNALTFWAKASVAAKFAVVGLANDNTGTSKYDASVKDLAVTAEWARYVLPIPLPEKLKTERGLFYFAAAAGASTPEGFTIWLDDVQFETLADTELGPVKPALKTQTIQRQVGDPVEIEGATATFAVSGVDVVVAASGRYFTLTSSDPAIVAFDAAGVGRALAEGGVAITGSLGKTPAIGAVAVQVKKVPAPTTAAPLPPARASGDVVSLFSNAYGNVKVDTWKASYSQAGALFDVQIAGDDVKKYEGLNFAAVEVVGKPVDASSLTTLHLDVWSPDATSFKVKVVDFGADGKYAGGDDKEGEAAFDAGSTPALAKEAWVSLEVPFSALASLSTRGHVAQLILSSTNATVYVDNVYFHR